MLNTLILAFFRSLDKYGEVDNNEINLQMKVVEMTVEQFVELSVLHDESGGAVNGKVSPALAKFVQISEAIDDLSVPPSQSFEVLEEAVFSEVKKPSVRNIVFDLFGF